MKEYFHFPLACDYNRERYIPYTILVDTAENEKMVSFDRSITMLTSGRIIDWVGEGDEEIFLKVKEDLIRMIQQDSKAPIELHVMSPGGEVAISFAFYDLVHSILKPTPKLISIAFGNVASSALIIFLAAEKNNRHFPPNASIFLHQVNVTLPHATYSTTEIVGMGKGLLWDQKQYAEIVASRTLLSTRKVKTMMLQETILSYSQAKKLGFVGHMLP